MNSLHVISQNRCCCRGRVSLGVRLYCWHMILVGTAGGVIAFISAVLNVKDELSGGESCWKNLF